MPDETDPGRSAEPGRSAADDGTGPLGVADVAVVPWSDVRRALGLSAEAGVVLDARRGAVKVMFPTSDRTFWISRDRVRAVAADRLPLHPVVARLHALGRLLACEAIEEQDRSEGRSVFHLSCGALDATVLRGAMDLLADDAARLRVEPDGSHRLTVAVTVAWPTRPPGVGAPPG